MDGKAPDSELISASASSPADFAAIFDRHFDAVYAYLQRRVGPDLAEELAAEAFLVAFDSRHRYDPARSEARPWLLGIATNLLRRHWRREESELRAYARSATDPVLDAFDGVEERLDASRQRRRLVEGLAELSGPERDALLLAAWADLSYAEMVPGEFTGTAGGFIPDTSTARGRALSQMESGGVAASRPVRRGKGKAGLPGCARQRGAPRGDGRRRPVGRVLHRLLGPADRTEAALIREVAYLGSGIVGSTRQRPGEGNGGPVATTDPTYRK